MKKCWLLLHSLFLIAPVMAFAGWEVSSKPETGPAPGPFFQTGAPTNVGFAAPNQYITAGPPAPAYAISICGSLKENLERIMGRYHWRVVWKAGYDYNFDGRVTGSSLPNVIEKLLQPFPLRAVMYMSNRTIAVVPRYRT